MFAEKWCVFPLGRPAGMAVGKARGVLADHRAQKDGGDRTRGVAASWICGKFGHSSHGGDL